MENRECKYCGKEFTPNTETQLFCSQNCANKHNYDQNINKNVNIPSYYQKEVLEFKFNDLQERYNDIRAKLAKRESEIEQLKQKAFDLERENKVKDDKHSLELMKLDFENSKNEKNSLSGVIGSISQNKELLEIVKTIIIAKMNPNALAVNNQSIEPNSEKSYLISEVTDYINNNDEATNNEFLAIVVNFKSNRELLKHIYNTIMEANNGNNNNPQNGG